MSRWLTQLHKLEAVAFGQHRPVGRQPCFLGLVGKEDMYRAVEQGHATGVTPKAHRDRT